MEKKLAILFAFLLILSMPLAASAEEAEEESPLGVTLIADFASDYMFRGLNYFDGTSIQPSLSLTYALTDADVVGGSVWAHFPGESHRSSEEKFTETDYTLNYEHSFGLVALGLGHVWYVYPDDDDDIVDTAEFFGSLSFDTVLSPRVSVYEDYREFDTQYYELALSQKIEDNSLGEGFNVTPYINVGFVTNGDTVYDRDSGLVQITTGLASDLKLGNLLLVTPSLNYTFEIDDATVNEFWLKISIGYEL